MKKEFNEYKERMKGAIPLVIIASFGIVLAILMLFNVVSFNSDGIFDNYTPMIILFLSGFGLYVAIKEIKRAVEAKRKDEKNG